MWRHGSPRDPDARWWILTAALLHRDVLYGDISAGPPDSGDPHPAAEDMEEELPEEVWRYLQDSMDAYNEDRSVAESEEDEQVSSFAPAYMAASNAEELAVSVDVHHADADEGRLQRLSGSS